jgi:FkbM family methyltransferase
MSWRTMPLVVWARSLARKTGISGPLARLLNGAGYEARYDAGFAAALREGDVVWDVGANVGHYTSLFSDRVGAAGRVVAFEPSPINYGRLAEATRLRGNVTLFDCGLGRGDGRVHFEQGSDELGATSRVSQESSSGTVVEIRSARSLLASGAVSAPNAVKIDVEGQEYEVLRGFGERLGSPDLRVIGIEVHFGILQARGEASVPAEMESMLLTHGFTVRWPDVSHILATRG